MADMKYTSPTQAVAGCSTPLNRCAIPPRSSNLEEFAIQVSLQKITNETITYDRIRTGVGELVIEDNIIENIGPALNSGRAILLYGPPGNGKTSVALSFANVFTDVIYVPYAVFVEGQIMRLFDPSLHTVIKAPETAKNDDAIESFVRREEYDARWVPCRRPFVITGGELTLKCSICAMTPRPITTRRLSM